MVTCEGFTDKGINDFRFKVKCTETKGGLIEFRRYQSLVEDAAALTVEHEILSQQPEISHTKSSNPATGED